MGIINLICPTLTILFVCRSALSASAIQYHQQYLYHGPTSAKQLLRPLTSGNIAAVEPYHHVPTTTINEAEAYLRQPNSQLRHEKPERELLNRRSHHTEQIYNHERLTGSQEDFNSKLTTMHTNQPPSSPNSSPIDDRYKQKEDNIEIMENLPEFSASKSDPKYQTLPYNTKFTVNYVTHPNSGMKGVMSQRRPPGEGGENICDTVELVKNNNNSVNHVNNNMTSNQQQLMNVVHSIPIPSGVNKGLATPLANQSKLSPSSSSTSSTSSLSIIGNFGPR